MAIIQDWKIRSTHARCEVTGESFLDGDQFYTCIFDEATSEGFIRRDYSAASWKKVRKKLDPAPFSFWKSTYKAPVRATEDPRTTDTSVEGMLRHFIDEDDPRTENARYILALMLERKKTLIPTDTKETESRTLLFYEHQTTATSSSLRIQGCGLTKSNRFSARSSICSRRRKDAPPGIQSRWMSRPRRSPRKTKTRPRTRVRNPPSPKTSRLPFPVMKRRKASDLRRR